MATIARSAPGKILIGGEYAVLEGYPAVATAVNRRVLCSFMPQKQTTIETIGGAPERALNVSFIESIFRCAEARGLPIPKGSYLVDSSQLYFGTTKIGLGSSAALCVALIKLLLAINHLSEDENSIFSISFQAHRELAGGLGSGIDIAASCADSPIKYQMTSDIQVPLRSNFDLSTTSKYLIAVFTGQPQSTMSLIKCFNDLKMSQPKVHCQLVRELASTNEQLFSALLGQEFEHLKNAFTHVSDRLMKLAAAMGTAHLSESNEKISSLAKECGGAAKFSGAGGGDISLCVIEPKNRPILSQRLKSAGFTIIDNLFSNSGNIIK